MLDKPGGITSRDAVDRALRWFPRCTRVGHTGTLDPLATGVLVLCVGAATRLTEYVQRMDKTYHTRLRLGARSDSDDADGTIEPMVGATAPSPRIIRECVQQFVGEIEQVPPAYSAAKVAGRRAYDLARRGRKATLEPRRVRVDGIGVRAYEYPTLELEVHCGKGTYIRSLARDLGERLGCGAYVEMLRRTRVGAFDAADGLSLDADADTARARLLPVVAAVTDLPCLTVRDAQVRALRQGQDVSVEADFPVVPPKPPGEAAVFDEAGSLVAIVTMDPTQPHIRPLKVIRVEDGP